jgi:S-DNA-T family DNA segregation ATPase FtsK/SpoIIIE
MEKTKKHKTKAPVSRKRPAFLEFWTKKETKIASGVLVISLALYLTIIFLSFIFTGSSDFSIIKDLHFSDIKNLEGEIRNFGGSFGAWTSNIIINHWFGFPSIFMIAFIWLCGLKLISVFKSSLIKYFLLFTIAMVWFSLALGFFFKPLYSETFLSWGGAHGFSVSEWLIQKIGYPGTTIIILASLIIFLIFSKPVSSKLFIKNNKKTSDKDYDIDNPVVIEKLNGEIPDEYEESWTGKSADYIKSGNNQSRDFSTIEAEEPVEPVLSSVTVNPEPVSKNTIVDDIPFEIKSGSTESPEEEPEDIETFNNNPLLKQDKKSEDEYDASYLGEYDPKLDLSSYKYPAINLLAKYENSETVINTEEQNSNKRRIQEVLEQFSIRISSITATVGATVTLYEIIPEPGIRISRIKSLENDIALSLAALGIRIIAPIPGKGTIGIEVPNRDPQIVSMYSVLNSRKFIESKQELPMVLGKTITNDIFMVDLCKMPHVLVAGATGQGKSVGLNAMITSLLYKKHPSELKFVMVDPKMVEFNIYSTIEKHFLAKLPDDGNAIVTDCSKVILTLNSLTREMDDRYKLLMMANVRNIKEYNTKFINRHLNPEKGHKFLPYIVVVIDEFGDLIMQSGKEIELPIARIAQKARAVGMHMIIATQRPTTNIITGTIKANFPARVAFRVISVTDSRTILDASGANQLIGRGDMLFSQGSDLVRVQCAFVDTPEVINITNHISNQRGYPTAFFLPEPTTDGAGGGGLVTDLGERDPLFEDAARLIVIHQQGSTSLVQRKLSLGYNRAGRIIDQLEAAGIIGPNEGSKARQVLVEDEYQLENILSRLK